MRRIVGWVTAAVLIVVGSRLFALSIADRSERATRDRAIETLRHLSSDLEAKADAMQELFPEGRVFTLALTGMAWTNIGLEDESRSAGALESARAALALATASRSQEPFGPTADLPNGLFYDAWTARLQTGVVRLAESIGRLTEGDTLGLRSRCTRLRSALEDGPLFPDSYPGAAWPADAAVAASALSGCAAVDPSSRTVAREWMSRVALEVDPETGLVPHATGNSASRGSSSALMVPFLAEVDSAFGASQYARALEAYPMWLLGVMPSMREYPRGVTGRGDIDSGLLVFGASAPASAVMIAASRSAGDLEVASALLASTDAIGWPVTLQGHRRYAAGALPVGDAFVAWASTVPLASSRAQGAFYRWRWRWRLVGMILTLLGAAGAWWARRGRQPYQSSSSSSSVATMGR